MVGVSIMCMARGSWLVKAAQQKPQDQQACLAAELQAAPCSGLFVLRAAAHGTNLSVASTSGK
jgi:hypothetical protein